MNDPLSDILRLWNCLQMRAGTNSSQKQNIKCNTRFHWPKIVLVTVIRALVGAWVSMSCYCTANESRKDVHCDLIPILERMHGVLLIVINLYYIVIKITNILKVTYQWSENANIYPHSICLEFLVDVYNFMLNGRFNSLTYHFSYHTIQSAPFLTCIIYIHNQLITNLVS